MYNKLLDPQYLDMNFEMYYLIPYPECKFFDEIEDTDEDVFPTYLPGTTTPASFVSASLIEQLIEEADQTE